MTDIYKEHSLSKDKKAGGLFKQLILCLGLGILLFVFCLFASGIFFTGIVVQNTNSAIKDNSHK